MWSALMSEKKTQQICTFTVFSVKIVTAFSHFAHDLDSALSWNFHRIIVECISWFKESNNFHTSCLISINSVVPSLYVKQLQGHYHWITYKLSVTARVQISQNFHILAKVYLVHLKVKHCQTVRVVSTYRSKWVNRFWLVKTFFLHVLYCWGRSKIPPCAHLDQRSKQLTDFVPCSLLATKEQLFVRGLVFRKEYTRPEWM